MTKVLIINGDDYKSLSYHQAGFTVTTCVQSHSDLEATTDVSTEGNSRSIKCDVKILPPLPSLKRERSGEARTSDRVVVQLTKK